MGTSILECGCAFSHGMFGEHELLLVSPCCYHATCPEVQEALKALAEAVNLAVEQYPWSEERA